jgi:hypothetical protein
MLKTPETVTILHFRPSYGCAKTAAAMPILAPCTGAFIKRIYQAHYQLITKPIYQAHLPSPFTKNQDRS